MTGICTIVVISIERYLAICRPIAYKTKGLDRKGRIIPFVILTWIVAAILKIPDNVRECTGLYYNDATNHVLHALLILTYVLVLFIVTIAYTKITRKMNDYKKSQISSRLEEKEQVIRVCIATSVVFVICVTPRILNSILAIVAQTGNNVITLQVFTCTDFVTYHLLFFNSSVNSIIYNVASKKYRSAFKQAFCSCFTREHNIKNIVNSMSSHNNFSHTMRTRVSGEPEEHLDMNNELIKIAPIRDVACQDGISAPYIIEDESRDTRL
ncbi:tachykinin-like peptides receptor 86C [Saccoglossus kowalevskii]|uniref:Growth hormone secretagogue receptor type 1-like n=1 Tax=Saccoglossus kowalevskii TaxID=10224 RepID=A0ABM0N0B8_SACKO|nr:PREDICTED: growth hormone secretagogue receptor type 1-like [Saccoglossus kowalevskii]